MRVTRIELKYAAFNWFRRRILHAFNLAIRFDACKMRRLNQALSSLTRKVKFIISNYYMALSHKDWELPNSRIWLAKTDIDRGLDFPI